MDIERGGSPAEEPDDQIQKQNADELRFDDAAFGQWAARELATDRLLRSACEYLPRELEGELDQKIVGTLRRETLRRFRSMRERFDSALPAEAIYRAASFLVPEAIQLRCGTVANGFAQSVMHNPREMLFAVQLRNSDGNSLVYHRGGVYAFADSHPGEEERPTAVNLVGVRLAWDQINLFLANPVRFPMTVSTFVNRGAFREQFDQIRSSAVLVSSDPRVRSPLWDDILCRIAAVFESDGAHVSSLVVDRIRAFSAPTGPGEFVCETSFGPAWVRVDWKDPPDGGIQPRIYVAREEGRLGRKT